MRDTITYDEYDQGQKRCFLCGRNGHGDPLDKHHAFPGALRGNRSSTGWCIGCATQDAISSERTLYTTTRLR